jgi:hypothetical protein
MRILILSLMSLLPGIASAGTDCTIVEYPERYEAVCVGEPAAAASSSQGTPSAAMADVAARMAAASSARRVPAAEGDGAALAASRAGLRKPRASELTAARTGRQSLIMEQRQRALALSDGNQQR